MKNYLLSAIAACLCFLALTPAQAQTTSWKPLGPADNDQLSSGTATYTSTATDSLGTLYVAYVDAGAGGKATLVKRAGSGPWTVVGTPGFTSGTATYTYVTIGKKGNPYVAYSDGGKAGKASVMMYNGTTWSVVGNAGFSAGAATYVSMAIDKKNNIYVSYADAGNTGNITVMKYSGSSWSTVGAAGFSKGAATYTSIAINQKTNAPYVAFCDGGNTTATSVTVENYNGSSWSVVGTAGFSAGAATYSYIAFDTASTPYVIFSDGSGGGGGGGGGANRNKATVMKYSSSTWSNVGTQQFTSGRATYCSISFTSADTLYASFSITAGGFGGAASAQVDKFTGAAWTNVGVAGFSLGAPTYNQIVITPSNGLYMVCADAGNSNKATCYNFNGTAWDILGSSGLGKGSATYTSLTLDSMGVPYAAYSDGAYTNKATVKMWTGSYWTTVGSNGFSAAAASYINIAASSKDSMYVIYSDGAAGGGGGGGGGNAGRATVMQFNGLGWLAVGKAGFTTNAVRSTSLDFGVNDTLFAAVAERAAGGGGGGGGTFNANVYTFNGTAWAQLGKTLSKGSANYTSIATDTNGVIYVAFSDAGNTTPNALTVATYNSGAWKVVGTAGFSAGAASYINLAVNPGTNQLFVSFSDAANAGKATVMTFNGTSWVNVGAAGFSPGTATYTSLDFDPIDRPYIGYADGKNNGRSNVMYFDSLNWVNSGNADFSFSTTTSTSLALDNSGNQYMLAAEGDPYAWKHACLLPPIDMQPASNSVCVGTPVYFVLNTDNSTAGFQWQYNDGSGWANLQDTGIYTGSATDSLVLSTTSSSLSGFTYRCILTNYCGMDTTSAATLTIVTSGVPVVTVTTLPSDTICPGTMVNFTASGILTGSTPTFQWKKNGTTVGTGTTYMDTTFANGDSIRCVMTSAASCASPATVNSNEIIIFVKAADTASVQITASADTVCGNAAVTYTATSINKAGGIISYQWYYNGAAVAGATASTYTHNYGGFGGGGYTPYPVYCVITITGNTTCLYAQNATSNSLTAIKKASITPFAIIKATPDTLCKGATVNFTGNYSGAGGFGNTYQWNLNGATITGATTNAYTSNTFNNGDSVSVTFTPRAVAGCTYAPASVTSKAVKLVVNPIITPSLTFVAKQGYFVKAGRSDTFIASTYCTGGKSASYQWYLNGTPISGATSNIYITNSLAVGSSLVKVMVTCNAPCGGSTSDSGVVTVTGINEIAGIASNISLFPNPNNGQFTVKADMPNGKYNTCEIEVINALGQIVSTQTEQIGGGHLNANINMPAIAAGLYLVRVKTGDQILFTGRMSIK